MINKLWPENAIQKMLVGKWTLDRLQEPLPAIFPLYLFGSGHYVWRDFKSPFLPFFVYKILSFLFFSLEFCNLHMGCSFSFDLCYRCCINPKDKRELPTPLWHQRPLPSPLPQRRWGQGLWYSWLCGFVAAILIIFVFWWVDVLYLVSCLRMVSW